MASDGDFDGAKLALIGQGTVLTLLRDDFAHIPFPNMWDFPGGARDPGETPQETVLRELREELGLHLAPADLIWACPFPGDNVGGRTVWFFAGHLPTDAADRITMGDEGQGWAIMPIETFLTHPDAIPHLQDQLRQALADGPFTPAAAGAE